MAFSSAFVERLKTSIKMYNPQMLFDEFERKIIEIEFQSKGKYNPKKNEYTFMFSDELKNSANFLECLNLLKGKLELIGYNEVYEWLNYNNYQLFITTHDDYSINEYKKYSSKDNFYAECNGLIIKISDQITGFYKPKEIDLSVSPSFSEKFIELLKNGIHSYNPQMLFNEFEDIKKYDNFLFTIPYNLIVAINKVDCLKLMKDELEKLNFKYQIDVEDARCLVNLKIYPGRFTFLTKNKNICKSEEEYAKCEYIKICLLE